MKPSEAEFNLGNSPAVILAPRFTPGASVLPLAKDDAAAYPGFRLSIPAGQAGQYRLAQLDDYQSLPRSRFRWQAPLSLHLHARVSMPALPGTWGFGWWNDPFTASLGFGGMARRLPALPNCAWFFFASPENYLSLRDDLPAQGSLAAVFASPDLPSWLLSPLALGAPLLLLRPLARLARAAGRVVVKEAGLQLELDPQDWHAYRIDWLPGGTRFFVDDRLVYAAPLAPRGRLGLVIWIDNQYAAFTPRGVFRAGALENPAPTWLEVAGVNICPLA